MLQQQKPVIRLQHSVLIILINAKVTKSKYSKSKTITTCSQLPSMIASVILMKKINNASDLQSLDTS